MKKPIILVALVILLATFAFFFLRANQISFVNSNNSNEEIEQYQTDTEIQLIQSNSINNRQLNIAEEAYFEARDTTFTIELENLRVEEPITYDNLTIFPIIARSTLNFKKYIPLSEALENDLVRVYETSDVQNLNIENLSDDYIFIHSGDVVKGGKQDRTLRYDVIVPPTKGKVNLASFCVESGRWQERGNEEVAEFSTSEVMLSNKKLKLAAKKEKDQGKVWDEVRVQQDKINENAKVYYDAKEDFEIRDAESETSLQLALENEELIKIKDDYIKAFIPFRRTTKNIIGFAYAINNEIYGVDIYNNIELFGDLWNKQINSMIVEAISEKTDDISNKSVEATSIMRILRATEKKQKVEDINSATQFVSAESSEKNLLIFTTFDTQEGQWIHRNMLFE